MQQRLSTGTIGQRMVEWRNLKSLHAKQRVRIRRLAAENKALRAENASLKKTVAAQVRDIQTLKLQMEELHAIVFGRKKPDKEDTEEVPLVPNRPVVRDADSYRRPVPQPSEVTKHVHHALDQCTNGHRLTRKMSRVFYTHDIPVVAPEIIEHTVETGWCTICKKRFSARSLPHAPVIFGPRTKRFVAVLSTIHRLSHPQIQVLLRLHFNTAVSDGMVANMLAQEAERLRPEKERLKSSIQISRIRHIDESSWLVCLDDGEGRSCWVLADGNSPDRVYELGRSRGKGVADELLGATNNVTVSDDYGAYRKRKNHQLCFAHPARNIRDLAHSPSLKKRTTDHCRDLSIRLAAIYRDIDTHRDVTLTEHFSKQLQELVLSRADDPKKLRTLKDTFRMNIPKYLTCLRDPQIPLTNNRAERDLRHVVLKRNVSFGSRNAKGAEHTGILLSCLMSRLGRGTLREYLHEV
jgi:hypothetical protein